MENVTAQLKAFKIFDLWCALMKECKSLTDEERRVVEQTFNGIHNAMEKEQKG